MDRAIFRWINGGPEWLDPGMRFFSVGLNETPMKLLLVAILLGMIAAGKTTRRAALLAILSIPLANEVTNILKEVWPSLRPCNDPAIVTILRVGAAPTSGTASAHAANMAAGATIFLGTLRGFGLPWAFLAFVVGWSRVFVGVHYPWQVALGWACGILVGLGLLWVTKRIEAAVQRRRESRAAAESSKEHAPARGARGGGAVPASVRADPPAPRDLPEHPRP